MKLAIVSAHPAPYRDPFLRRIAKRKDVDVKIYSLFSDDKAHAFWNLESHGYPSGLIGRRSEHWLFLFVRLVRRVIFGGYDFILWPGFHRPCVKAAVVCCALLGKKYGFCADTISQPRRSKLSMIIKRFVVRHAKLIFVPGAASKNFFVSTFSYPEDRICLGQYALEGDEIERNVLDARKNKRDELRAKYEIAQDSIVFLMVANMIPSRHYPITAEAFVKFAEYCPNARFVMVGKGPELAHMEEMSKSCKALKVIPGVSFADMQELYAVADVYVHGGCEPASTALVIGAISHLPLISSPNVGCSADVIVDGKTGVLVHDYLSENEWSKGFDKIVSQCSRWQDFGREARELSRQLDCEYVVAKFVEMVLGNEKMKKGNEQ